MSSERKRETFEDQAERNIDDAAMRVARGIQSPGQTKEQTRLIAQGIAKGIAQYKKQQNEKARERDKARKRLLKQKSLRSIAEADIDHSDYSPERDYPAAALLIGASVFAAGAIAHIVRFIADLQLTIGSLTIPRWWSLPVALLAAALAAWMLGLVWTHRDRDE